MPTILSSVTLSPVQNVSTCSFACLIVEYVWSIDTEALQLWSQRFKTNMGGVPQLFKHRHPLPISGS